MHESEFVMTSNDSVNIIYFPHFRQEHFDKDIGLIGASLKGEVIYVGHNKIMQKNGYVAISGIIRTRMFNLLSAIIFLILNSKKIRALCLLHVTKSNFILCAILKLFNPKALTYIKADINYKNFNALGKRFWRQGFSTIIFDKMSRYVDHVSVELKRATVELATLYPSTNIVYLPNTSKIKPNLILDKKNIVLYVGRIGCKHKNIESLFKIADQIEFDRWEIHLVGDFVENGMEEYYGMINANPTLRNKIIYKGSTRELSDLESYYAEASFILLTSINEGFPLVIMEAMSQSCGVITTKQYFTEDAIDGNGYVYEDEKDLLIVLNKIFKTDANLYNDMHMRSHQIFDRSFRRDMIMRKINELIEQ